MKHLSKLLVAAMIAVIAGAAVAPASVYAATDISNLVNRKAGLGDLFTLDRLFSKSNNGILKPGGTDLGNLMILNQLFPVKTASVSTAAAVSIATRLSGRIVIQTQADGAAWYINPTTKKRVALKDPATAYQVMAAQSVGISNADYNALSQSVPSNVVGRFILKVEDNGKLYYVNPVNKQVTYVGGPADAQALIKSVGLGISNSDINQIAIAQ
jgi:hypothetical protein